MTSLFVTPVNENNEVTHKFDVGDIVWTVNDDNAIIQCHVGQITLEMDPDDTLDKKIIRTYHLDPLNDMDYAILLRPENGVFESVEEAVCYNPLVTPTITPTVTPTVTPTQSG
jgi:hypothetical protein